MSSTGVGDVSLEEFLEKGIIRLLHLHMRYVTKMRTLGNKLVLAFTKFLSSVTSPAQPSMVDHSMGK